MGFCFTLGGLLLQGLWQSKTNLFVAGPCLSFLAISYFAARIQSGDLLLFNKCLMLQVQDVHQYATFHEMLEAESLEKVFPGVRSIKEGVQIYRDFYSEEKETANGVLGVCVIRPAFQLYDLMVSLLLELSYGGVQRFWALYILREQIQNYSLPQLQLCLQHSWLHIIQMYDNTSTRFTKLSIPVTCKTQFDGLGQRNLEANSTHLIKVELLAAKNLIGASLNGSSDPYAIITRGAQKHFRCFDGNLIDIPVQVETPDRHYYHLAFFTKRKVKALEELTWDYGIDFDDHNHPIEAFQCSCGSQYCRDRRGRS